eukprot:TRINITY_DN9509_c1_g1_i1.p1 TRINITY_DN9509_c1_g1~~TRINITY_DN9509_c1_g1_i1.p1  ORF type:complete len:1697 (+),score=543.19 TRINITY_DN9509_c1_g1_i1:91-5181(+)
MSGSKRRVARGSQREEDSNPLLSATPSSASVTPDIPRLPLPGAASPTGRSSFNPRKYKDDGRSHKKRIARKPSGSAAASEEMQDIIPLGHAIQHWSKQRRKQKLTGEGVLASLKYASLIELLPATQSNAFLAPFTGSPRPPCTHSELRSQIERFDPASLGIPPRSRIGIALGNGPELAAMMLLACSWGCAAPVNPANTSGEIEAELRGVKAQTLVVAHLDPGAAAAREAAARVGIPILVLHRQHACGLFRLERESDEPVPKVEQSKPSEPDDSILVLHTSGTSGKKKIVPYLLKDVVAGSVCIAAACELTPSDVDMNMMPLFHIGGIARNVFAPILAAGSVIAASAFDPAVFWDTLVETPFTWYYAGPTMHQMLLAEAADRPDVAGTERAKLRIICNAAGALLPAVAAEIRRTFMGVNVLPSYGMTECMPITAPPVDYELDRPGSSGQPIGPDVVIRDENWKPLGPGAYGRITIKGCPLFRGYEGNPDANKGCFNDGWFDTGDMGHLDTDNHLFITGRSKEVVNRGGEIISPFEVEECLLGHPAIANVMAFAAPHETLQETIGVVVVPRKGCPRVGLAGIQKHAAAGLHPAKWPQMVIYMPDLPKGQTGKAQRIKLANRVDCPEVDDASPFIKRTYEADKPPYGAGLDVKIPMRPVTVDMPTVCEGVKKALPEAEEVHAVEGNRGAILAYVTPELPAAKIDEALAAMAEKMDEYLVPVAILSLAEMPRDSDGNVDEEALPKPQQAAGAEPQTETEATVHECWAKVLPPGAEFGCESDFFEVGGSSLLAGQLVAIIRRKLGVAMSGAALFSSRTVRQIAAAVDEKKKKTGGTDSAIATPRAGSPSFSGLPFASALEAGFLADALLPTIGSRSSSCGSPRSSKGGSTPRHLHDTMQSRGSIVSRRESTVSKQQPEDDLTAPLIPKTEDEERALLDTMEVPRPGEGRDIFWSAQERGSPTAWHALVLQLFPIVLWHPFIRTGTALTFTGFWILWIHVLGLKYRFAALLLAILMVGVVSQFLLPLLAVIFKWVVVGRLHPGRYPLWGNTYMRWWLSSKISFYCGYGIFGSSSMLFRFYLRMMGASVGAGASISTGAQIGEHDLLHVGEGAAVDTGATLRCYSLDAGGLLLRHVYVGEHSVMCSKSQVVPGHHLKAYACLSPNASTHELPQAAHPRNRAYCRAAFPAPPAWRVCCIGAPVIVVGVILAHLPWFFVLKAMTEASWYESKLDTWKDVAEWFLTPNRIGVYLSLRAVRDTLKPAIELVYAIIVKKLIIGKIEPGRWTDKKAFQRFLINKLLHDGKTLGDVGALVGTHYEYMSIILRALGAKVGKRVYWPGSGVDCAELDLFEVGDDCVFGSRSTVMCADEQGLAKVNLKSGSFLADRCFVLPGTTLGTNAVLGSGSLAQRDYQFEAGSTYVGSDGLNAVKLEGGSAAAEHLPTLRPFGKAFYNKDYQGYTVLPLPLFAVYNTLITILVAMYHSSVFIGVLALTKAAGGFDGDFYKFTAMLFAFMIVGYIVFTLLTLALDIGAKWLIIGRRMPGPCSWDQSSYPQRWQLYLQAQYVRRSCFHAHGVLDFLHGSQYIVWYFRALGCKVGKDVCMYPQGADPMMTEPDLVTLGDGVCLDSCSVVAHLNTKGMFQLNTMSIGDEAVLRRESRLLSGANMMKKSTLLERTLLLGGETADEGSVWQGWPAKLVHQSETSM